MVLSKRMVKMEVQKNNFQNIIAKNFNSNAHVPIYFKTLCRMKLIGTVVLEEKKNA